MFTPTEFGCPHPKQAITVMLLGAGELGKEVAIAFARYGVVVHAVDRYAGAPAHQVADVAHVVDMTDPVALRELITTVQPDVVVPEIEAVATSVLQELEDTTEVTVIPTAQATCLTMDREGIRRLAAAELGLPTSPYAFAGSLPELQEAAADIGFPCVIKPVMSSSGKGQSVAHSAAELPAAWETAQRGGRVTNTRVIVEGFVDFDYEITLLTVKSIDPATGQDATWFCEPIGHQQLDGDYVQSWQPAAMSDAAKEAARSIAARITTALGGRGVFGVELFVAGDDVLFSEVSPRPHDTGMVTMASQRCSEFELHARAILGLPIDVTLTTPGASQVIYGQTTTDMPAFTGLREALAIPESQVRLFGKPSATPRRRMGVALATADTVEQARQRAAEAASCVRPVDTSLEGQAGQ
ncbi:formate-dependent phosphoribosylglycinamide formyltransferase [Corynebacterium choanae]|uniref:Formate-dependent phosphoribosylglycinamide formyltransferase n=1 Tax=Corynebacterium choanae TaxID=1862358 RepID=A0A3G6J3S3_9CORY|nr:formate-dependent phosphoribosylglycinamide formyltransferase [Corynebacterium choanae]AZA12657.1 Phosphoribosylglycinamide formyltransferase 2 [Corynebacterium choanae]